MRHSSEVSMMKRAFASMALAIACAVLVGGQSPLAGTWEGETGGK